MQTLPTLVTLLAVPLVSFAADAPPTNFGFVIGAQKQLLALTSIPAPQKIEKAVCAGGAVLDIKFLKEHQWNNKDIEGGIKERAMHFEYLKGPLFQILKGDAKDDVSCALFSKEALGSRTPAKLLSGEKTCVREDVDTLTKKHGVQNVVGCERLGSIEDGRQILVLKTAVKDPGSKGELPQGVSTHDVLAFGKGDLWSVSDPESNESDDGQCQSFDYPPSLGVLFVLKEKETIWIGTDRAFPYGSEQSFYSTQKEKLVKDPASTTARRLCSA